MRILIDSNVLLRTVEHGHAHHQASVNAITLLRKQDDDLAIVPQVLYEFWSVATRPVASNGLGMSTVDTQKQLESLKHLFRFMRDERGVYSEWEQLVGRFEVKGKKSHDARLAAAMQRHDIKHILTFNTSDFKRYPAVSTILPTDVATDNLSI